MTETLSPACALCGTRAPLENSHIIPHFVFRWLKETSGTGFLRQAAVVNRRVQDGIKVPMLCGVCEDRFSTWETRFARHIFHPFTSNKLGVVKYDDWLLKFATSVCWRVLEEFVRIREVDDLVSRWSPQLSSCRETWKQFLLGQRADVGEHHVHMLRWDGIVGGEGQELPPNINRYLRRAIEMNVPCSESDAFTYVKLGPIILFGMIGYPGPKQWRGTRIYLDGKIKPGGFLAPSQYGNYILDRARNFGDLEGSISKTQMEKIGDSIDIDRLLESGTLAAMAMDYRLFGEAAFSSPGRKPSENDHGV